MRMSSGNDDLFLSENYLSAWLESFGSPSIRPTIVDPGLAVLSMQVTERRAGLPLRIWRLCVNDHSLRAPLLYPIGREAESAQSLLRFLRERRLSFDAF